MLRRCAAALALCGCLPPALAQSPDIPEAATLTAERHVRTGEEGLGRLERLSVEASARAVTGVGRLTLNVTPTWLDAGRPSPTAAFGTVPAHGPIQPSAQRDDGVALGIEIARDPRWRLRLGTTPLGLAMEDVVGGLLWQGKAGEHEYKFEIERAAVTDSLLAFGGRRDPHTGIAWGGVRQSRVAATWSRPFERWGPYAALVLARYDGRHVPDNDYWLVTAGTWHVVTSMPAGAVVLATNVTSFSFERNLSHFTLGHGGYYSPAYFSRAGVSASLEGARGAWRYKLVADGGWQHAREDAAPFFPLDPQLGDQRFGASRTSEFGGGGHVEVSYAVTPLWQADFRAAVQHIGTYTERTLRLQLQRRFDGFSKPRGAPKKG